MIIVCIDTKFISQKLKDLVLSKNVAMGSTLAGRDWCIKALHPSDPLTEVRGIPDESAIPSLFMNYQTVATISPDNTAVGTWSLDGQLIPNPLSFGAAQYTDSVGTRSTEFVNSQIPGADHVTRLSQFLSDFSRWRLAYASVTIYQDGPDLANQGTVTVCQKPVDPCRFNVFDGGTGELVTYGMHHAFNMSASDLPDYTKSQAMPNAYFGKSKEGVYIPLKLTKTHQHWNSQKDLVYQANSGTVLAYTSNLAGGRLQCVSNTDDVTTGIYPFLSINELHQKTGGGTTVVRGTLTSDFCNENWADFSFRNMAVTTSLSFFFRFGFEVQVQPTSLMSPHLKLSPEYDPQALMAYFAISRELKDAYPADYNDLGKIWGVISTIAKTIAPALGLIPGVGPLLSVGLPAVAAVGDRLRSAKQRASQPTLGSTASMADLEAVRKARANPRRAMPKRKGRLAKRK